MSDPEGLSERSRGVALAICHPLLEICLPEHLRESNRRTAFRVPFACPKWLESAGSRWTPGDAHTALTCDDVRSRTNVDGSEGPSKLAMPVRSRSPAHDLTWHLLRCELRELVGGSRVAVVSETSQFVDVTQLGCKFDQLVGRGGVAAVSQTPQFMHVAALAGELLAAYASRLTLAPLTTTFPGLTVEDAYRIQQRQADSRVAGGAGIVGFKIGLTSTAMQQQLGVDQPDYGHLFADMVHSGDSPIATAGFLQPRAEPEIALVLGRPLPGPGITVADLLRATDFALPAIEIIDSRYKNFRFTLTEEQMEELWRLAPAPILCFDGDAAGSRAAARAAELALPLLAPDRSLKLARLPAADDP